MTWFICWNDYLVDNKYDVFVDQIFLFGCIAKYITTTPATKNNHIIILYLWESPGFYYFFSSAPIADNLWLSFIFTYVGVSCFANCLNLVWIKGTFWPVRTLPFFYDPYLSTFGLKFYEIVSYLLGEAFY